jgi:hypothetical protein
MTGKYTVHQVTHCNTPYNLIIHSF